MSDTWRNRIVGSALVDASTLTAHPDNWRLHPDEQGSALSSVLDDIGWVQEIIVNKTTGRIIDGHLRAELAIRRNEQIPVKYVELTEAEEESVLLTYDPLAAMAKTNAEKLDALLQRNNSDRPEIQRMMAELAERAGMYGEGGLGGASEPPGENGFNYQEKFGVLIECATAAEQEEAYNALGEMGYKCKVLVV